MSATPPPKDAFAALMHARESTCPADDPWRTAVLYEAHLEHADPSEPLWRVPYFGQIVRSGTADEIFKNRKQEHEQKAARDCKELGFHAVIDVYGSDAIEWRIVLSESGRRIAMHKLANFEEKRLIAENGGVLRNADAKLVQTLNLTKGGQGDGPVAKGWFGIDVFRRRALNRFMVAMEAYVEEYESALVPVHYVDESKYPLGMALSRFRRGNMRHGMPEEGVITEWAEALPQWTWNGIQAHAEGPRQWWATASVATKEARAERQLASLKRQREENPEKEAARLAKVNEATRKGYEARLEGLTPRERKKRETKHAADLRGHRKRQADLQLLRTVMPDAKIKDIARAKREGWMPEAAK